MEKKWTDSDLKNLIMCKAQSKKKKEIAKELHRSGSAIEQKSKKLGLNALFPQKLGTWTRDEIAALIDLKADFFKNTKIAAKLKKPTRTVNQMVNDLNLNKLYTHYIPKIEKPQIKAGRNSNDIIGRISELRVAQKLLCKGYDVFFPDAAGSYCDIIVTKGGSNKAARIEVKTGSKVKETFRYSARFNARRIKTSEDFIKNADFYIISIDEFPDIFYVIPTKLLAAEKRNMKRLSGITLFPHEKEFTEANKWLNKCKNNFEQIDNWLNSL